MKKMFEILGTGLWVSMFLMLLSVAFAAAVCLAYVIAETWW